MCMNTFWRVSEHSFIHDLLNIYSKKKCSKIMNHRIFSLGEKQTKKQTKKWNINKVLVSVALVGLLFNVSGSVYAGMSCVTKIEKCTTPILKIFLI